MTFWNLNLSNLLKPWVDEPSSDSNWRTIASGNVAVPGSGSAIIGPFVVEATEIPQILAYCIDSGAGNIWGESTGIADSMQWEFYNNLEPDANSFSVRFVNTYGGERNFRYVVLGFTP